MKKNKIFQWLLLTPVILYSVILIALPLLYILALSFLKNDAYGSILLQTTLENYRMIFDIVYVKVFLKSFAIAAITTFICVVIAYPFAICVSQKSPLKRNILITLVMVPFLTNSLIRMYGWIILLRKEGLINNFLTSMHFISRPFNLMYNDIGIIIGMVYTLLPFMILPVYSSVCKIGKSQLEAAADLGANKLQIFFHVIVKSTIPGLFNGSLMVFIPAIGYFFISDILGGGKLMLLGNLIKNQFLTARNWPFGAAISIVLIMITFFFVKLYKKLGGNMDELGGL